ncbi:MAG: cytochrome C oxidase subunit IV family protein [Caldilineaceae bacterium]
MMTQHTAQPTPEHTAPHGPATRTYYLVYVALMVLLALTVGASFLNLGPLNEVVALVIAVAKAVLVILFFMHVRYSSRVTWLFVAAGFVWLLILVGWTFSDYLSRGWVAR